MDDGCRCPRIAGAIYLGVISHVVMRPQVKLGFPGAPVAARSFAGAKRLQVAVDADPECIEWRQDALQVRGPFRLLDDVLDDQVVGASREGRDRLMESVEEPAPF